MDKWFMEPYNGMLDGERGAFTVQYLRGFVTAQDVALLKSAGMTNVRLPVDPAAFMDQDTGKLAPALLGELDFAIARFVKAGIGVQVDAHVHLPALRGMAGAPEAADKFVTWWTEFAAHLGQTTNPEFVFLEVLNEFGVYVPYAPAGSRFRWMADVRKSAESHGFGWAHWDYCTGMPIVSGEPGARQIDPRAAAALGLNANAGK